MEREHTEVLSTRRDGQLSRREDMEHEEKLNWGKKRSVATTKRRRRISGSAEIEGSTAQAKMSLP